ncbi:MAG: Ig-like domain-containing protein [Clostridia bacterium]|nr:Ig-like domain-containing protein [Clostridia bacterium]
MNKTIKRIIAVLTAILVCYAALPVFAFAGEEPRLITKVVDGVSEYGLEQSHYEDSDGNIVDLPKSDFVRDVTGSKARRSNSLPSSYNSFTQGNITPVKSQGSFGNCWAFTAIGCMEAYAVTHMDAPVNNTDYSEAHLTWYASSVSQDQNDPMYGDGLNYSDPFDHGGNAKMAALCFARGSGVTLESDYPFDEDDASQMGNYNDSTARYEHNIGLLDGSHLLSSESEIKQAIIDNGGVATSYCHIDSCLNHDGYGWYYSDGTTAPYNCTYAAYYCDTAYQTNHAVMIVGWDDNYSKNNFKSGSQPSSDGAWICKNSWGNYFGVNGLFWISYEDATLDGFQTFSMTDNYDYVSSFSGACYNAYYSLSSDTKMANVFVSQGDRTLEAAGFLLEYDNVPVTVSVYKGMSATPSSPVNGSAVATVSGTFRAGYNTVKFPSPVTLSTGERYSIVVEMAAVNNTSIIPIENNYGQCSNGTSYIYYSNRWRNCYSVGCGNTFVYAYTNDIPQTVNAQSISINQNSQSLYIGQTLQLTATVLPPETDNPAVTWSSSAPAVASVDSFGLVYAYSTGTAVITAAASDGTNLTDSITITVLDNHFTLTYYVDSSQYAVLTYIMGQQVSPPSPPSKTGYNFAGWLDSGGNSVTFPLTVNADLSLYASFTPKTDIPFTLNVYTMDTQGIYPETPDSVLTYYGTTGETVTADYSVPEGFSLDPVSNISGTVQGDGSLVLDAYLSRNIYTVTAVTGDVMQAYDYYYGQRVEPFAALPDEGYIFAGWQPALPAVMPAQNITVTPVFVLHLSRPSIAIVTTGELSLKAGESVTVYTAVRGGDSSFIEWSSGSSAISLTPSYDGSCCVVTAVRDGSAVITVKLVSSAGDVLASDSAVVKVSGGASYLFNNIFAKNSGQKFRFIVSLFELVKKMFFEYI